MTGAGAGDPEGSFAALPRRALPRFPSWWAALGPGVVWMALAQGSSGLVAWPHLVAKYGLTFVWLLIPACLLQYPLTVEIGRYTLLTGESIFRGFSRLSPALGVVLWLATTIAFLWLGAFAAAGGTAMAALTGAPAALTVRGRTLVWAYGTIAVFVLAIVTSGGAYRFVERLTKMVALVTVGGLLWAGAHPEVRAALPSFLAALAGPPGPSTRGWDVHDSTALLTAIAYVGLGGFWVLLWSYWLREKGSGMAGDADAQLPDDEATSAVEWRRWRRYLGVESLAGIVGNCVTTLMTCLLAYALLYRHGLAGHGLAGRGLVPEGYEIVVAQSAVFEAAWGTLGRVLFLVVGAAFLTDTWLVVADGVSRMHADIVYAAFPRARRWSLRQWYFLMLALLTAITCLTLPFEVPGTLLLLSTVIGFAGMVLLPAVLFVLNYRRLAPVLPPWARPRPAEALLLAATFLISALLAVAYLWSILP